MTQRRPLLLRLATRALAVVTAAALTPRSEAQSNESAIRVACVGASITAGFGTADRATQSYPAQLAKLLGSGYDVRNFGASGCTMLKKGDRSYWSVKAYEEARALDPQVVVIDLGGNDSKAVNWVHRAGFAADARAMVESFRALPAKPRVLLCLPMPSFKPPSPDINDDMITKELIPALRRVGFETGAELIDLHTAFADHRAWFADGVHPNAEGAALAARIVGDTIALRIDAGFDFERNLAAVGIAAAVKSFHGYRQLDFAMAGGRQCTVVRPVVPAAGRPIVWRGEFFGHQPQTDLALLQRGYHVVYVNAKDMFGAPPAMEIWDQFHALLQRTGLTGKIILIGMSRGGLYCYHWAARHPESVAALYGDAPVCDFKSWPLALGKSKAPRGRDAEALLKAYGFKDESEALAYAHNPVDNLAPLARAGIPLLHVVGQADTVVPVEENTDLVEQRYRALGGTIEVIRKPGVEHHPHSLENPAPIVDFILRFAK